MLSVCVSMSLHRPILLEQLLPDHCVLQMQGQMAVCGAPWCDFMAVCTKTRDIMLQRVFFQPRYWEHIASRLKQFCFALQVSAWLVSLNYLFTSPTKWRRIAFVFFHLQWSPLNTRFRGQEKYARVNHCSCKRFLP